MNKEITIEMKKAESGPQSPVSPTSTAVSGGTTIRGEETTATFEAESDRSSANSQYDLEQQQIDSTQRKRTWSDRIPNPFAKEQEPEFVREVITRRLEDTPNGYPRLAAFQASESNFALYRGFSYLHSRVLLDMQDELTALEKELDELDQYEEDPRRLRSRSEDIDGAENDSQLGNRTRRQVLADIKAKLTEYDEFLMKAQSLTAFQRPADRNYRSVRRYLYNTKPLLDDDMDSIRCKEDILSLRNGREWAGFDGFVESILQKIDQKILKPILKTENPPLQTFFRTPELQHKTSNKHINFYSSSRIDTLIGILITLIISVLLVAPVVAMYRISSEDTPASTFDAVGVLVIFTLLFSAAMSLVTKAERHELFAASAAYCAILVVFISNFAIPGH